MYKLTQEQADFLRGKTYSKDRSFNPIDDINGEWFLSPEEVEGNTNWRYRDVLASLEQAEFIAPVYNIFE